jgi:hypothetical protein
LGDGVVVNGTIVTVTETNLPISGTAVVTIPAGVTLDVPAGKAVTVENGGRLDVPGTVAVGNGGSFNVGSSGTVNVTGTITVGGGSPNPSVKSSLAVRQDVLADEGGSGGRLTVENGGTLVIIGTVTGATGGQIVLAEAATVTGAGKSGVSGEPASDGKAAAKIVLESYGYIGFYDSNNSTYRRVTACTTKPTTGTPRSPPVRAAGKLPASRKRPVGI